MITKNSPIAVVDSGMGGITVLRKLHRIMPNENYIYFGDSANSPYGTKTKEQIRDITVNLVEKMMENKAGKAFVKTVEPVVMAILLLVVTAYLVDGSFNPFLYFRF